MKTDRKTAFFWAWNDAEPQPDKQMTRTRAARMLWAWRRTSRTKTSHGRVLRSLTRLDIGRYFVVDRDSGESATMIIQRGAQ